MGSILGLEAKIPPALWPKNHNMKQKQDCNKFNKDFQNGSNKKKKLHLNQHGHSEINLVDKKENRIVSRRKKE